MAWRKGSRRRRRAPERVVLVPLVLELTQSPLPEPSKLLQQIRCHKHQWDEYISEYGYVPDNAMARTPRGLPRASKDAEFPHDARRSM